MILFGCIYVRPDMLDLIRLSIVWSYHAHSSGKRIGAFRSSNLLGG
jgi:hypothetical protein